MASFMSSLFYQPVSQRDDGDDATKVTIPANWNEYPALRTPPLAGVAPPSDSVLVKTGGNALQAVDRKALQQDDVVAVAVPWYGRPGHSMIVRLQGGRVVRTEIPWGMQPGHVFLVQVPPVVIADGSSGYADFVNKNDNGTTTTNNNSNTRIAWGEEIPFATPIVRKQQQPTPSCATSGGVPDDLRLKEMVLTK